MNKGKNPFTVALGIIGALTGIIVGINVGSMFDTMNDRIQNDELISTLQGIELHDVQRRVKELENEKETSENV